MNEFVSYIKQNNCGKVLIDMSLKNYNTYKVNAKAKYIVFPSSLEGLKVIVKYIKDNNLKYKILGNGSNVIFKNNYYDGIIIKLDLFNDIQIENTIITVGAGYSLTKLSMKVAKLGLTGLEFACGIPGTVGGAVYMNAGAYKYDMGYIVKKIKVLTPELEIKTMYNKELDFHYRSSFLKKNTGYIVLQVTLNLKKGKKDAIIEVINNRREKRLNDQPLEYPSAGSVFRNPEGSFAGKLIEDCGLKGFNINGAEVSTKHANFIINKGKCKGNDIVELINTIKDKVKKEYNIDLFLEQEIID